MDILGQLRHIDDLLHLFISTTPLSTMDNSRSDNAFLLSKSGLENVRSLAFVNSDNSVDIIKASSFDSSAIRAEIMHKSTADNGRSMIINGRLNGKGFQTFLVVPDNRGGEH